MAKTSMVLCSCIVTEQKICHHIIVGLNWCADTLWYGGNTGGQTHSGREAIQMGRHSGREAIQMGGHTLVGRQYRWADTLW